MNKGSQNSRIQQWNLGPQINDYIANRLQFFTRHLCGLTVARHAFLDTAFPQLPLLIDSVWLARACSSFIFIFIARLSAAMLQEMGKRFEVRIGMQALHKQELLIFQNGSDLCKALLSWNWKLQPLRTSHSVQQKSNVYHFASVLKPHSGRVFERLGRVGRGQRRRTFRGDCVLSTLHTLRKDTVNMQSRMGSEVPMPQGRNKKTLSYSFILLNLALKSQCRYLTASPQLIAYVHFEWLQLFSSNRFVVKRNTDTESSCEQSMPRSAYRFTNCDFDLSLQCCQAC